MRFFLTAILTVAALLLAPVVNQSLDGSPVHPNLCLIPLVFAVSLCPGATAVIWCGMLGLVLDCLAGPQLGMRAAGFSLLAAFASTVVGGRDEQWPARLAKWATLLFAAEVLSRLIDAVALGGQSHFWRACGDAALSAGATTLFLGAVCLAGSILFSQAPRRLRRLALSGDAMFGD
jgi:rod shape-determining protein MreD